MSGETQSPQGDSALFGALYLCSYDWIIVTRLNRVVSGCYHGHSHNPNCPLGVSVSVLSTAPKGLWASLQHLPWSSDSRKMFPRGRDEQSPVVIGSNIPMNGQWGNPQSIMVGEAHPMIISVNFTRRHKFQQQTTVPLFLCP